MLGCYRATRALLRRLGTEGLFDQGRRLELAYRWDGGRVARLALPALPVPLAMPFGLLGLGIGLPGKLRALRGMIGVLRGAPAAQTLADWLRSRGQHGEPTDCLWQPLCRAIMNVEPERVAAADFLAPLREAFTGRAGTAAFWLPRASWGEILGDPAPQALAAAGVALRTGARVVALHGAGGERITAIELGSGERIAVAAGATVVSALPWFALRGLLPGTLATGFGTLASSPIVTAHFALDPAGAPPVDDGPVVALVRGEPFHFLMRTPGGDRHRFALLAGGNRALDGQPVAAIEAAARAQLARCYPGWDPATPAAVRISKENLATFVAAPGSRALRPRPGRLAGGPANLLVCGDWTDTGLPATLEGAARSAAGL
jgi:hypothetical protein